MDLFIIRHAESANNRIAENTDYATFVATRTSDPPITDLGEAQADRLAQYLAESQHPEFNRREHRRVSGFGINRIVCSPMLRTLQTASPSARALNLPLEVWTDIYEQGGLFDGDPDGKHGARTYPGLSRAEMENLVPGVLLPGDVSDWGWWMGGYEDMEACAGRAALVAERLDRLASDEPGLRLAIVTHGTFINLLLHAVLGVPLDSIMYFFHANTGITRIEYAPDGYRVLRYANRIAHLEGDLMTR